MQSDGGLTRMDWYVLLNGIRFFFVFDSCVYVCVCICVHVAVIDYFPPEQLFQLVYIKIFVYRKPLWW